MYVLKKKNRYMYTLNNTIHLRNNSNVRILNVLTALIVLLLETHSTILFKKCDSCPENEFLYEFCVQENCGEKKSSDPLTFCP